MLLVDLFNLNASFFLHFLECFDASFDALQVDAISYAYVMSCYFSFNLADETLHLGTKKAKPARRFFDMMIINLIG